MPRPGWGRSPRKPLGQAVPVIGAQLVVAVPMIGSACAACAYYTYSSQRICGGGMGSIDECVEEQIPRSVSRDVLLLRHSLGEYDAMGTNTPRSHSFHQSRPPSLHPDSS